MANICLFAEREGTMSVAALHRALGRDLSLEAVSDIVASYSVGAVTSGLTKRCAVIYIYILCHIIETYGFLSAILRIFGLNMSKR